jgi:hypothetical protein
MNHKASNGASTDLPKLSLPNINNKQLSNESTTFMDATNNQDGENRRKGFKFGQVDHNMLITRLYSTPFNKTTTNQQYVLDMGATSIHKPRIKKLDNPPTPPEPVVFEIFPKIKKKINDLN